MRTFTVRQRRKYSERKGSKVTPNDRRIAKVINFGLMYGMSPFGLAKNLGIGRDEAKNYINKFFARFPGVHDYWKGQEL